MASPDLDVAVGATISMTGTGLTNRRIEDFMPPGGEVEILPASHQGTTGALDKIAADLPDYQNVELVVWHDQDYDFTADLGTKAETTFTGPSGATAVFQGIFASYRPQRATINDKMLADLVIAVASKPVITAAA